MSQSCCASGVGRQEVEVQLYTSRTKKLGSSFISTKSEPVLAWMDQWLPKHSGNFSPVILLKGYFFLFVFLSHSISLVPALLPPITLLRSAGLNGSKCPNRSPAPRGSITLTAPPTLFPAEHCWLYSQWGCSPSHSDTDILTDSLHNK